MKTSTALTLLLAATLSACSSSPPAPPWQRNAQASAERAVQAYLSGQDRVADLEWQRAQQELQSTGRPQLLARLALLRCAAEVASLQAQGCPAFAPWRTDAPEPDLAYADYLAGQLSDEKWLLLPSVQRIALQNPQQLPPLADPLPGLLALAMRVRSGAAQPGPMGAVMDAAMDAAIDAAIDTAAAQGWRRPLLAWLLLRQQRARASGDVALAERLQRRLDVVQAKPGAQ